MLRQSKGTKARLITAAATKTQRHPWILLTQPEKVRASSTPSSRPVMTMPMARPRWRLSTRSGAIGSTMWVTTAKSPTSTLAAINQSSDGATATSSSATETAPYMRIIRARRSSTSPSGTKRAGRSA